MATQSVATISVRPCVITTPFGTPVVPEVKRMSEGSSGPERGAPSIDLGASGRGWRSQEDLPRQRRTARLPLGDDDRLQRRQRGVGTLEHGDVVRPEEVGHGHEDTGTAAGEDDGRLGTLEARVDGHQDGAGGQKAERRHRPLDAVAAPDGHAVARLDSRRDSAAPNSRADSASSAYVRVVDPSRTATRSANCVAALPTMAGMEGQGDVALTAGPKPIRRRPLRMVLFPYNNDTFTRRPHTRWAYAGSPHLTREGDDMVSTAPAPYYDPYDFDIDADPYPVWKRLRDEAPLYYNEKYDFYAISRYDDVERASVEWQTYSSAKGSVLEIIKAQMEMPPGLFIFEDPPDHDLHRGHHEPRLHPAAHGGH